MTDVSRLPSPLTDVWDWQLRGACRTIDNAVFFHPEGERGSRRTARQARAKLVCARCPVIDACRTHALAVAEPYGVWGGMSETERGILLRARDRPSQLSVSRR